MLAQIDAPMRAKLLRAMPGLKERAKTLVDLMHGAKFLFAKRPLQIDEKAAQLLNTDGKVANSQSAEALGRIPESDWTAIRIEQELKSLAEAKDMKLGKLAQPLRAALTGTNTSPGIFDVLEVLGRQESLARIKDHLA